MTPTGENSTQTPPVLPPVFFTRDGYYYPAQPTTAERSGGEGPIFMPPPIFMIAPEHSASHQSGQSGQQQPPTGSHFSYPMPPPPPTPLQLAPPTPLEGDSARSTTQASVPPPDDAQEGEEDRQLEKRKNVMDAVVRKEQLEADPWASEVKETSVRCRGCRKVIKLDGRYLYYRGLWDKHRDSCRDIKRLKGEDIPKRTRRSAAAIASDKGTPETDDRSISPAATPERTTGRAHSEPWEYNARSHSCTVGESSRASDGDSEEQRPVLPGIHTFFTGPGVSGAEFNAYLLNRYGRRSLSPPGATSHFHKSGCLLASRNPDSSNTQVRGPPLYRCSTPYELATGFGGFQERDSRYVRDSRWKGEDGGSSSMQ